LLGATPWSHLRRPLMETCRHTFKFRDSDAKGLENWSSGRLSITRDFMFGTINKRPGHGSVVDCTRAWDCLRERANDLAAKHTERTVTSSQLILGQLYQHFCVCSLTPSFPSGILQAAIWICYIPYKQTARPWSMERCVG
jgi:hypothetical protein